MPGRALSDRPTFGIVWPAQGRCVEETISRAEAIIGQALETLRPVLPALRMQINVAGRFSTA